MTSSIIAGLVGGAFLITLGIISLLPFDRKQHNRKGK